MSEEKAPTPQSVRDRNLQTTAESQIQISQSLIEPKTGQSPIGRDVESMFRINNIHSENKDAWDMFTTINSDVRLSNLNPEELEYVRWAMKLHLADLQANLPKSSAFALLLQMQIVESSLAKEGFLRNIMQTIKQDTQHLQIEEQPKKPSFFGGMFGGKK